jgi:hypothetical protein
VWVEDDEPEEEWKCITQEVIQKEWSHTRASRLISLVCFGLLDLMQGGKCCAVVIFLRLPMQLRVTVTADS